MQASWGAAARLLLSQAMRSLITQRIVLGAARHIATRLYTAFLVGAQKGSDYRPQGRGSERAISPVTRGAPTRNVSVSAEVRRGR